MLQSRENNLGDRLKNGFNNIQQKSPCKNSHFNFSESRKDQVMKNSFLVESAVVVALAFFTYVLAF